jgi:ribosomal protein L40E
MRTPLEFSLTQVAGPFGLDKCRTRVPWHHTFCRQCWSRSLERLHLFACAQSMASKSRGHLRHFSINNRPMMQQPHALLTHRVRTLSSSHYHHTVEAATIQLHSSQYVRGMHICLHAYARPCMCS